MHNASRDPVLLIAVAPAEDELLFHQELLTLAVTHPRFPLFAACWRPAGNNRVSTSTRSMLSPLIRGDAESDSDVVRNKRIRATAANLSCGGGIRPKGSENRNL